MFISRIFLLVIPLLQVLMGSQKMEHDPEIAMTEGDGPLKAAMYKYANTAESFTPSQVANRGLRIWYRPRINLCIVLMLGVLRLCY